MRKYIRAMIRSEGERKHLKPSRWVKTVWESSSHKKYGVNGRKVNQARGTHKGHLWSTREALFVKN
jgi:hypothetical protein